MTSVCYSGFVQMATLGGLSLCVCVLVEGVEVDFQGSGNGILLKGAVEDMILPPDIARV